MTLSLNIHQIALLNSALARVARSESHKFKRDDAIAEIESALKVPGFDAQIDVYDIKQERFLRVMFLSENSYASGDMTLEILVGPQPERPRGEDKPDIDPTDPNAGGGTVTEYKIAA